MGLSGVGKAWLVGGVLVLMASGPMVVAQGRPPVAPAPVPEVDYRPEGEPRTLPEVLEGALNTNASLQRAAIEIRRADATVDAQRASLSPVLQLGANRSHRDEPTSTIIEQGLRITDTYAVNSSLAKRLRWGTDVTLSYDASWFRSVQPFSLAGFGGDSVTTGPFWNESLNLTLRQPLLRGFGSDVNLASLHSAELSRSAAQLAQTKAAADMVLAIAIAYLELAYADRDVQIRADQITVGLKQREATVALVSSGKIAPMEMDVIDARLILLREAYFVSLNQRRARSMELTSLVGDSAAVRPTHAAAIDTPHLDDDVAEVAVAHNAEIAALSAQRRSQQILLVARVDAVRPQLDLNVTVGQQGLSERYLESLDQVATLQAGNFFVGLTFAVPLDNGRAQGELEADRLALERLDVDLAEAKRQVGVEALKARDMVRLNLERAQLSERSVVFARRTLEAERAKFRAGRSTNQTVLQFHDQMGEAQLRLVRSRVDVALAVYRLLHVEGLLLAHFGLEMSRDAAR